MTNKQSWGEELKVFLEKQGLNTEYYKDFVITMKQDMGITIKVGELKDFISNLLTSKSEQMEREKYKEIKNGDNESTFPDSKGGDDTIAMFVYNKGLDKAIEILKK